MSVPSRHTFLTFLWAFVHRTDPLELLTQLSVILMVHFARLEIALQLTYGCAQCVFLLQQTCSDRYTGIIFTTRP